RFAVIHRAKRTSLRFSRSAVLCPFLPVLGVSDTRAGRVSMADELSPPKAGIGDYVIGTLKGIIGEWPIGGSTPSEFFSLLVGSPLEARRQRFFTEVADALKELQNRQVDVDSLRDDPAFIDTVLQTVRVALSNHQQEKLEALQNAIVNSALPRAPEP